MKNSVQVLIQEKVNYIFKLLEGAREPVSADINALNATIGNLRNYYAADDLDQAIEYATLATKQAGDVASNLERAKATKGAVDQIKNQKSSAIPTASTLHQKVEDTIPGEDTDDLQAQPNTGDLNSMKGQNESVIDEEAGDGMLKFKIKVKAKIPIEGEDIKAKPTTDKEEAEEDAGKTKERATKDVKKAIKKAEKGSSVEVEESKLTEAKIGDEVIYNGNGAQGYQGKKAKVVGMSPDGAFAIIQFEDGAVYKGAKVEKLQPATAPVADPLKAKVQGNRVDQLGNVKKPFDQKSDDETFELDKQMALPSKERPVKEGFAIGISTPQAVGAIGAPAVKNTEEIEKDAKKDDRTKENADAVQNNKGLKDGSKNEAKIEDLLNPNDEKARQEIMEMCERVFLAIRLSEKTELTEKEKAFIKETNEIKVDEAKKSAIKTMYRKMFGKVKK